jgi:hypothetical protein
MKIQKHYEIIGSATIGHPPDSDGHPYRAIMNGVKVYGGPWSSCRDFVFQTASDFDTLGDGRYFGTVGQLRDEERDFRRLCGVSCNY